MLSIHGEDTVGEFKDLEYYQDVFDRFKLQKCFQYECLCVSENNCPAEYLYGKLSGQTQFRDAITDHLLTNKLISGSFSWNSRNLQVDGKM